MPSERPVGHAGRGRHTGKVGWLGGNHRKNDGCLSVIVGVGFLGVTSLYGIVSIFT